MLKLRTVTSVKELALERGWRYTAFEPEVTLWFPHSRTTTEVFRDFIANSAVWTSNHKSGDYPGVADTNGQPFARLYALDSYSIAESFACELPDALLIGKEGVISTAEGEVLVESYVPHTAYQTRLAVTLAQPDIERRPRLEGIFISLRAFATSNYCHWLLDALPRLMMLEALSLGTEVKFILPTPLKNYQIDSIRLFGLADDQMMKVEASCVEVERLIMCQATPKGNSPQPEYLLAMTQHIKSKLLGPSHPQPSRRIYVARANTTRRVVNDEALFPVLRDFGFEVVYCEHLSFAEQVLLFAEANVVLGAHGAGMCNHIFCAPGGATVIELYNPHFFHGNVQRTTGLYKHDHWHMYGAPVDDGGVYNMRVDPHKLRGLLQLACPL